MLKRIQKSDNAIIIDGKDITDFEEFSDGINKYYILVQDGKKLLYAPHGLLPSYGNLKDVDIYIGSAFSTNDRICVVGSKSRLFRGKVNQIADIIRIAPNTRFIWIDLQGNNINELAKSDPIYKSKIYLKPGEKPPKGLEVHRGSRGGLYYETKVSVAAKEPVSEDKEDYLYNLSYHYVNNLPDKNPKIFDNFYANISKELTDDSSILSAIGDIVNNLPEAITLKISEVKVVLLPAKQYSEAAGMQFWGAVYDPDYATVVINDNIYKTILDESYDVRAQYHRVLLHEYVHSLYYTGLMPSKTMVDLWDTKERVSSYANTDFDENMAESVAAFLMALSSEGDVEDNLDLQDFKEDYPKTYAILTNWLLELKDED